MSSSTTTSFADDWSYDMTGDFTHQELLDLIYIALSFSLLSAVGSIFIIVTYWKFPRLHTFAYRVIMMLAVANLCLDCAYLVGNVGHDNWKCTVQGWARVYFSLVEFGLITVITFTCYLMIVKHEFGIQDHFKAVMAFCWITPLVMSGLPFITNNYGDAGAWCSITSKDLKSLEWGTFWRFTIIYIPLWIAVCLNAYMYFQVYRAVSGFEAAMSAYDEPPDSSTASSPVGGAGETGVGAGGGTTPSRLGVRVVGGAEPGAEVAGRVVMDARGRIESASSGTDSVGPASEGGGGIVGRRRPIGGSVRGGGFGGLEDDPGSMRSVGSGRGQHSSTSMTIVNRLRLYPMALVICWSWATVNRVREAIDPYGSIFWLYVLQYSFQTTTYHNQQPEGIRRLPDDTSPNYTPSWAKRHIWGMFWFLSPSEIQNRRFNPELVTTT